MRVRVIFEMIMVIVFIADLAMFEKLIGDGNDRGSVEVPTATTELRHRCPAD